MNPHAKAALLIRSLMRDLRVSDHVVYPHKTPEQPNPKAIVASVILRELDAESANYSEPHVQRIERRI